MTDLLEIQNILERNDIVFIDNSFNGDTDFLWDLYDKHDYESLDKSRLEEELKRIEESKKLYNHEHSVTIREVADEFLGYSQSISDKCYYLGKYRREFSFTNHRGNMVKRKNNNRPIQSTKRDLLEELQKESYDLYQIIKQKTMKIKDHRFIHLLDMVKLITLETDLKKDYSHRYECHSRNPYSSDTDERLFALFLWTHMHNDMDVTLMTADSDFKRMFSVIPWYLGSDDFLPYNQQFIDSIKKHPYTMHYKMRCLDDRHKDYLDSLTMSEFDKIMPTKKNNETFDKLKDKILSGWKELELN